MRVPDPHCGALSPPARCRVAALAYASNEGSGTVSMIDTATDKDGNVQRRGQAARDRLSPDGKRLT
jgi:hypothetical protein